VCNWIVTNFLSLSSNHSCVQWVSERMIRVCVISEMCKTYLTKPSEKLIYLGFQCLLPRGLSDLISTPRGRPYDAVTQLREIPVCKSSFLKVHLARGVTTWVPTHAPQLLVTRPGSVSAFLSYHAHGSPLGVALSWVVSVPRILQSWRGYFTSQVTPY